jgi:hypothetical protein
MALETIKYWIRRGGTEMNLDHPFYNKTKEGIELKKQFLDTEKEIHKYYTKQERLEDTPEGNRIQNILDELTYRRIDLIKTMMQKAGEYDKLRKVGV